MKRMCIFSIILVCLVVSTTAYAQTVNSSSFIQKAKIGLVDEFFKRFNGQETHPNIKINENTKRRDNLLCLFDTQESFTPTDSIYKEVSKFIEFVLNDSVSLNYEDPNWVAWTRCRGTLQGKSVRFNLFLNVQHRNEDMYKWVISKVDGDCFDVTPRDTNDRIIISPDSHETKFISIRHLTREQPYNISLFMNKSFSYDPTSVFTYLVKTNQLKIDYVEELEFIFTQIPEYLFHIKYFERESTQSGWLINKFYKMNEEDKKTFLKSINIVMPQKSDAIPNEIADCSDNSSKQDMKELFYSRMKESVQLAKDYLSYLQCSEKSKQTKEFYAAKLKELFTPEAQVCIQDSLNESLVSDTISITQLCDSLLGCLCNRRLEISAICIPKWQNYTRTISLISHQSEKMDTEGTVYPLSSPSNTLLQKEDTEDGIEVVSKLGNMYLKIIEQ